MSIHVSPAELVITPRPLHIPRDLEPQRWWLGGDAVGTAVMNALSLTFPDGERFFIQSVRRFSKELPGALADQVRAFVQQEGAHTREHLAFNDLVRRTGYEVADVERFIASQLDIARSRPAIGQLAATVALEHFTAAFAHVLLTTPALLDNAPEPMTRLWKWHSIEEIEHKGVAYDVFQHATRDMTSLARWRLRVHAMALTTLLFTRTVNTVALQLLAQDGVRGVGARLRLVRWLWLNPGLYRRILKDYLAFYRPGFHPWERDDRPLMHRAQLDIA